MQDLCSWTSEDTRAQMAGPKWEASSETEYIRALLEGPYLEWLPRYLENRKVTVQCPGKRGWDLP